MFLICPPSPIIRLNQSKRVDVKWDDILLLIYLMRNAVNVELCLEQPSSERGERTAGMRGRRAKGRRFARKITLPPEEEQDGRPIVKPHKWRETILSNSRNLGRTILAQYSGTNSLVRETMHAYCVQ